MKRFALLLFIVFSLQNTIAQEFQMIRHEVQLGETVRMISRKYKIEPAEIYRLNKFAVDGISQGMVLQLAVPIRESVVESERPVAANTAVETQASDTESSASQDSDGSSTTTTKTVTTTIRKKKTTESSEQAQIADAPGVESPPGNLGTTGSAFTHTVVKGESLFSIARKYNVSVDDIKSQNEKVLKRGLQPGQLLAIIQPGADNHDVAQPTEPVTQVSTTQTTVTESSSQTEVRHKVQKGETLFSLSRKYDVPVEDIKMQNEQLLKKGLQIGMVLTIQTKTNTN